MGELGLNIKVAGKKPENVLVYPPGTQPPATKPGERLGPETSPIEIDPDYDGED